jgi:hypothetical protein
LLVERNVKIHADQRALAFEIDSIDSSHDFV